MKNVITTGRKNKRPSTDAFSAWLTKRNHERDVDLHGIEKYIMNVEIQNDYSLITTFNGSVYSLPFNQDSHDDLIDLIGYKVTFYPKDYESYDLEAYFIWNWEKPINEGDFGFLVVNKVAEIQGEDSDSRIVFSNGDYLPIPYKDYEKPYFQASKRMHGEDKVREGYKIDFGSKIEELKSRFINEFVVYSTNLRSIDVAGLPFNTAICTYDETAHYEWAEKDKYKFRLENGVIKSIATWDTYTVPMHLEDGRIMVFNVWDYLRHIDGSREIGLVNQLKKDLQENIGKQNNFMVIFGGDKRYKGSSMDVVSIESVESGLKLPRFQA
jgi:hypothetical protein